MEITRRAFCLGMLMLSAARASEKRLLVLGGTKFLGPAVVDAAVKAGYQVTLFHRGKTPRPAGLPPVEEVFGDRNGSLQALRGRRFELIIDTSGQEPVQVRASANQLKTDHYVFVSTISVYAEHDKPGLREDAALVEGDQDYGGKKARCEEAVREAYGDRCTIARPCVMAGPLDASDRFTYWVARMQRGGSVLGPGDGQDPVQLLDVRDAADFLVAARPGTFNLIGVTTTTAGMLEACRTATPAEVVWVNGAFLDSQQVELPLWADRRGDWRGFFCVDGSKAALHARPLDQTAADVRAGYAGQPLKVGLTPEREQKLLRAYAAR